MLEHHAAIVAILEKGKVTLTDLNNEIHEFAINGGFCEQHENTVIICAEVESGKWNGAALNEAKRVKVENERE